ncbi:hypothetical protein [Ralstonia mannitolilytica]|uniref:hypothetical protein n=1 Tax=Ralstonia mannitolilytica TaxID=105219 RepID=UPI0011AF0499|nr:hypothetical protein [Ralstonia mannitolilytica]
MAINLYDQYDAERRAACHAAYEAHQCFPGIAQEAARRGYRHATLSEINASAESMQWAPELFCWRGGLWVRAA